MAIDEVTPEGVMRQVVPELRRISEVFYGVSTVVKSGEACGSAGAILWGATEDLNRLATSIEAARTIMA